jgi:hypothetical protein
MRDAVHAKSLRDATLLSATWGFSTIAAFCAVESACEAVPELLSRA